MIEEIDNAGGAKILIVDDEAVNVRVLSAMVSGCGYAFDAACNGMEALAQVRSLPPDLILLDIMMPELDGYETCRRLKGDPLTSHIPIVMVTALDRPEDISKGFEAGADEFLTKPVNMVELAARIRNLLKIKRLSEWVKGRGGLPAGSAAQEEAEVLIVEDDASTAKMMQAIFERDSFHTVVAADGATAWSHMVERRPDVVILDLFLQDMHGLEVLKRFRNADPDTPVVITTMADDLETRMNGIENGADEYLIKPVRTEELILRVKALLKRSRMQKWLRESRAEALRKAITDHLTGLYNREYLHEYLTIEVKKSERYLFPLSIVMVDIDHFKSVNDNHGHSAGDLVLSKMASLISATVRGADLVFRYGGEEFLILMPCTDERSAVTAAERVRAAVNGTPFKTSEGEDIGITISAGVYMWESGKSHPQQAIMMADAALYDAKNAGRNRVVAAGRKSGKERG